MYTIRSYVATLTLDQTLQCLASNVSVGGVPCVLTSRYIPGAGDNFSCWRQDHDRARTTVSDVAPADQATAKVSL
jgi:hypothetical protein